ncbi:MAG: tRNA-intron lyase [Candidatus Diapherotrites archaeon]|uniref:tRNA-intron lyase n=1 Tax=Candidatus Iainarchaeum sp. TaxID=3101447 RepID=A0A7K4BZ27_9ARCH|nr:tRNA-intron lyase [Candidatus Diapherotrites archaeon]
MNKNIEPTLIENKIIIGNSTLKGTLVEKGFGESKGNKLILDLFEAIYLMEKEKIKIIDVKGKKISTKKIFEIGIKGDKQFYSKQKVHEDLREKGYCIKTGLKFGFDFRVYPRGKKMGEAHSQYGIHVACENEKTSMTQISRMTRLAGNIHIRAIIAVVDREDEINYYEINRKLL